MHSLRNHRTSTLYGFCAAAQATICYTGDISDPRKTKYTLDYYLEMADALVSHGLHTLCIKDMVRRALALQHHRIMTARPT